jgi:L-threonylcarbamoyladenylate synthase
MILDGSLPDSIVQAARAHLRSGALVGLPTSCTAAAADADSDAAVARVFASKGRPSDHPLIVHVASADALQHFAREIPDFAQALVKAFWPGPLTVILPRRAEVAAAAAGSQDSIGLRCPAHPVAQALLAACAAPPPGERAIAGLAAPSANRFGRVSPTTAQHVQDELGSELLVLDGGACAVGIESTIVDCTRGAPVLLRPGAVTREQIEAICGRKLLSRDDLPAHTPRASGTLESHYAPQATVRLMNARALQAGLDILGADAAHLAVYARAPLKSGSSRVLIRRMPDDARRFAVLRGFDDAGVRLIWVEAPPEATEWEGVRDRLQRAAA